MDKVSLLNNNLIDINIGPFTQKKKLNKIKQWLVKK